MVTFRAAPAPVAVVAERVGALCSGPFVRHILPRVGREEAAWLPSLHFSFHFFRSFFFLSFFFFSFFLFFFFFFFLAAEMENKAVASCY